MAEWCRIVGALFVTLIKIRTEKVSKYFSDGGFLRKHPLGLFVCLFVYSTKWTLNCQALKVTL